jgi:hypothetical protein
MSIHSGVSHLKAIADARGVDLCLEPIDLHSKLQNRSHLYFGGNAPCGICKKYDLHIVVYYQDINQLLWILGHEIGHAYTWQAGVSQVELEYNASAWALKELSRFVSLPVLRRGAHFLQAFLDNYIAFNDAPGFLVDNKRFNLPLFVKRLEENSSQEVLK